MESLTEPMHTAWPFPFVPQDWEQTPPAVQAHLHTLQDELTQLRARVEALEARLKEQIPSDLVVKPCVFHNTLDISTRYPHGVS